VAISNPPQCLRTKYNTNSTASKKSTASVMIRGKDETGGAADASIFGAFGAAGAATFGIAGAAGIFIAGAAGILGIEGAANFPAPAFAEP